MSNRRQILSGISGRVCLARGAVGREAAARTEQTNYTVGSFLDEGIWGGRGNPVTSRISQAQRLEASAARREDDVHKLDEELILYAAQMVTLLLA